MFDLLTHDFDEIFLRSQDSMKFLKNQRLFITGGTGFFGKWILGFLNYANTHHSLNLEIYVLSRNPENFLLDFPQFNTPLIKFVRGDIRNFELDIKVDFVIHAATEASAKLNGENPEEMFNVIVDGTRRVFDICKKLNPSRILITSSGAIYGTQPSDVIHQPDESRLGPDLHDSGSAYAEGKRVSELLSAFHHRLTGQEVVIARCFAFVGPFLPLDSHFAVGNFMQDCLLGRDLVIKGDGTPSRSYMYAADLVVWLLKVLTHGKNLRSYNVGSEESLSIAEVAQKVRDVWIGIKGQSLKVQILSPLRPEAPIQRYVPKANRAKDELNLSVKYTLHEAIFKTLTWHTSRD